MYGAVRGTAGDKRRSVVTGKREVEKVRETRGEDGTRKTQRDRWDYVYWYRRPRKHYPEIVEAVASNNEAFYVVAMTGKINQRGEYEVVGEPVPIEGPAKDPIDALCGHWLYHLQLGLRDTWDKEVEEFCREEAMRRQPNDEKVLMKHLRIRRMEAWRERR